MNDCAWCGTGNGICADCMSKMFAKSEEIAATGTHLASTLYGDQGGEQEEQTESSQQAQTSTGGR